MGVQMCAEVESRDRVADLGGDEAECLRAIAAARAHVGRPGPDGYRDSRSSAIIGRSPIAGLAVTVLIEFRSMSRLGVATNWVVVARDRGRRGELSHSDGAERYPLAVGDQLQRVGHLIGHVA